MKSIQLEEIDFIRRRLPHETGGGAIGKERIGRQLFATGVGLRMERTQFTAHHQYPCIGFAAHNLLGGAQTVKGCRATHKTDQGALYRRRQPQIAGDDKIQPWRKEAGATDDHQMADRVAHGGDGCAALFRIGSQRLLGGSCAERRRFFGIDRHPFRRGRCLRQWLSWRKAGCGRRQQIVGTTRVAPVDAGVGMKAMEQTAGGRLFAQRLGHPLADVGLRNPIGRERLAKGENGNCRLRISAWWHD